MIDDNFKFQGYKNMSIEDDMLTEEDELLFTPNPGPRLFVLNGMESKTFVGILIDETDDSMLVGLPTRMIEVDDKYTLAPLIDVPYTRILKSSVFCVTFLFEPFATAYKKYVETVGAVIWPGAKDYLEDWKDGYDAMADQKPAEISVIPKETSSVSQAVVEPVSAAPSVSTQAPQETAKSTPTEKPKIIVLGATNEELMEYLSTRE